ncbi:MAG: hypothetical protein ACXWF1_00690 [Chthoniobacterales bacterium]
MSPVICAVAAVYDRRPTERLGKAVLRERSSARVARCLRELLRAKIEDALELRPNE